MNILDILQKQLSEALELIEDESNSKNPDKQYIQSLENEASELKEIIKEVLNEQEHE